MRISAFSAFSAHPVIAYSEARLQINMRRIMPCGEIGGSRVVFTIPKSPKTKSEASPCSMRHSAERCNLILVEATAKLPAVKEKSPAPIPT